MKVKGEGEHRSEALRLAAAFGAKTLDATLNSFVFELTGATEEIDRFVRLMSVIGWWRSAGPASPRWGAGLSRCRIAESVPTRTLCRADDCLCVHAPPRPMTSAMLPPPQGRHSDGSQGRPLGR